MTRHVHEFSAMGSQCVIRIDAMAQPEAGKVSGLAEAEVRRIEARYSRFRDDSDLARINRVAQAGGSVVVDDETAALIGYAFSCFARSDGAFDITSGLLRAVWDFSRPSLPDPQAVASLLPRIGLDKVVLSGSRLTFTRTGMELDLGGLGKEYAADRAAELCLALGARHGFVNLGGDIRVIGPKPDGSGWRVGIRDPVRPDGEVAGFVLSGGALATSGSYERFIDIGGRRFCHLLDPRTGCPVRGLWSASVVAERCLPAGSLATTAMLKGEAGEAWLQAAGPDHLVVDDQGRCRGSGAAWINC